MLLCLKHTEMMTASHSYCQWFVLLKVKYQQIIHLTMSIYQSLASLTFVHLLHGYCLAKTAVQLLRTGYVFCQMFCYYYPHMPVGMLRIYHLLSVFCLFVFLSAGFLVTDISGVGWRRAMKFCRMVGLGVYQVICPFGELWPRVSPPGAKNWKTLVMHIS